MRSAVGWFLPAVAVGATVLAVWAGPTLVIAVPAATVAVLAAALLFAGAWLDERARPVRRARSSPPAEEFRLRTALRSGRLGREEVVLTLDRAERSLGTPGLSRRTVEEMDEIAALPLGAFHDYLRGRLDDLEARQ